MIAGEHTVIRAADIDDAPLLWQLYDRSSPRSFILGPAREVLIPSRDELQELLTRKDLVRGVFFIVEDKTGLLRGCCALRGASQEAFYCEMAATLVEEADYATPLADEVMAFLRNRAFNERKLNKVVGHCLTSEEGYRAYLVRHGFRSDGVQRRMVYTQGRYFDLESLSLFNDAAGNDEEDAREPE